jgi:hypothetical protein
MRDTTMSKTVKRKNVIKIEWESVPWYLSVILTNIRVLKNDHLCEAVWIINDGEERYRVMRQHKNDDAAYVYYRMKKGTKSQCKLIIKW